MFVYKYINFCDTSQCNLKQILIITTQYKTKSLFRSLKLKLKIKTVELKFHNKFLCKTSVTQKKNEEDVINKDILSISMVKTKHIASKVSWE